MARDTFDDLMREGRVPLAPAGGRASAPAPAATGGLLPPYSDHVSDTYAGTDSWRRNGIAEKQLRDLRRAPLDDTLDLHGMTGREAHAALDSFLQRALGGGGRVVEIVHGRGSHSSNGVAVLRTKTHCWLQHCDAVMAYCHPPRNSGALRALLRGRKTSRQR